MKTTAIILSSVTLFASTLAGCSHSSNVSTASSTTSTESSPAAGANGTTGAVLVKAGTVFRGKLQNEISSKKDHDGDKFTIVNDGETIYGHLENVHAAGLAHKPSLVMVFDNVTMANGEVGQPVDVTIENARVFNAKSHHLRTVGMMVGGAIAGHMAGKAAGKKHGGLAGAASGYVLSQEMKTDVDVKPGTTIVLKFNKDAIAATSAQ